MRGRTATRGKKSQAPINDLPQEAWDFANIANDEVEACWEWEFFKEFYERDELFRNKVEAARKAQRGGKCFIDAKDPKNIVRRLSGYPIVGLAGYSQGIWPKQHFLQAAPHIRTLGFDLNKSWIAQEVDMHSSEVEKLKLTPPIEALLCARSLEEFTHVVNTRQGFVVLPFDQAQESLLALRVPWRKSDEELTNLFNQVFKSWIKRERGNRSPAQPEEKRGKKPISKLRKELKSLGAKRLIGQFGTQVKARDYAIAKGRQGAIYADPKDWSVAKNIVKKILDEIGPRSIPLI